MSMIRLMRVNESVGVVAALVVVRIVVRVVMIVAACDFFVSVIRRLTLEVRVS